MSVTFEHSSLHPTLASAQLPRRVRRALEQVYNLAADEMARALERMLVEFEQQQFRLADQAPNPGAQQAHFDTLRLVRQNRADLIPEYLSGLEAVLAGIRNPASPPGKFAAPLHFGDLRLVEDHELDESSVLRAIASRHESRTSLPLHLLGQRFGVLAGAPAFDAERLPVGPHQLSLILANASRVLQVDLQARLDLFRCFDHYALNGYAQLVEAMNATLVREGILPNLAYVPIRARPAIQAELTGEAGRERREQARARAAGPHRPYTGWFGGDDEGDEESPENFTLLQDMLASRRDLLNKLTPGSGEPQQRAQLSTEDVMQALARMQVARDPADKDATRQPRSVHEVRQALLAQTRQAQGQGTALTREDNDSFELLAILLAEIQRELHQDAPGNRLVHRLVVPLLRLVLKDRGFFVQSGHPARQLLNAVAESGANWVSEEEVDPQLNDQLSYAVDDVVAHYQGDSHVFEAANQRVQHHLQTMARRAEVAERRHVEAARGKEKLELAKRLAANAIEDAARDHKLPRFVQTLLANSWTDVLTLILLRNGDDSEEWQQQLETTHAIVRATSLNHPASPPPQLAAQIEQALTLVGYHAEEAGDIARRLTAQVDDENDSASRTELALRLKARGRLGQEAGTDKPDLPPRTEREQAAYDMLRTLPFGAWLEFVINQQGDVVRRRLSWYSPVTDHALFVNQRGQRVGEQSLDSVARALAHGQARIVTVEHSNLVDRAWHSALGVLRGFVKGKGQAGETGETQA